MRILIACEESQEVCKAFRELGHEAYSCDIIECSGGYPSWHIQDDVLKHLNDGWDMIIAHPPCTYLTVSANKWLKEQPERKSNKLVGNIRKQAQKEAIEFVKKIWNSNIKFIVIENPVGVLSSKFMKPTQIIEPYYFGHDTTKKTCLWIKGLPKLDKTDIVKPRIYTTKNGKTYPYWSMIEASKIKDMNERSKFRSKTFPGIAKAMAKQWGNPKYIQENLIEIK